MTEQESKDIEKARMLVSLDALTEPKKALVARICDGFVEKCAQLACIREKSEALMASAAECVRRRPCGLDNRCGTPKCPQGYGCPEQRMKDEIAELRKCLGAGEGRK